MVFATKVIFNCCFFLILTPDSSLRHLHRWVCGCEPAVALSGACPAAWDGTTARCRAAGPVQLPGGRLCSSIAIKPYRLVSYCCVHAPLAFARPSRGCSLSLGQVPLQRRGGWKTATWSRCLICGAGQPVAEGHELLGTGTTRPGALILPLSPLRWLWRWRLAAVAPCEAPGPGCFGSWCSLWPGWAQPGGTARGSRARRRMGRWWQRRRKMKTMMWSQMSSWRRTVSWCFMSTTLTVP